MAVYRLKNDEIQISIDSHGAELRSLTDVKSGREYMWCGDAAYWGRVSPVLFPVVGSYRNKECRYMGKTYQLSQHGFARDMEFALKEQTEAEIWFQITDNEETLQKFPFAFVLELGYRLEGRSVKVLWQVKNPSDGEMYFSIGGHPAFAAPERAEETTCYLGFTGAEKLISRKLRDGLATDILTEIALDEKGLLPVTEEIFAEDALIIENRQTNQVQLLDGEKKPYLTVSFEAPLFGLWTPPGKNAPFICIEPWYGRCDKEAFTGNLEEREWGNILLPQETFKAAYTITV